MAENNVVIGVEVEGVEEAKKDLNQVAQSTQAIGDQSKKSNKKVNELGESFNALGQTVEQQTKGTTRGIMAVQNGLGGANDSAVTLGRAMVTLADNGSRGMIAILGPVGAVIATIYTLYEGYQQLTGAAKEYEKTAAVSAAVASDLTSKLDALATKGIRLSSTEMQGMIKSIFDARMGVEYMNEQIAESQKIFSDRIQAQREINILLGKEKDLVDKNMWFFERWTSSIIKGTAQFIDFRTQQEKMADAQEALSKSIQEEDQYVRDLTKAYAEKYEASIKEEQAQLKREATRLETIDMLKAEYDAQMALNQLVIEAYSSSGPEERARQIKLEQIKAYENLAKATSMTKDEMFDEAQRLKEINTNRRASIEALANEAKIKREIADEDKKRAEEEKRRAEEERKREELKRLDLEKNASILKKQQEKQQEDLLKQKQAQFKARQMQIISEQSQINALEIQLTKSGLDEQIALAENSYNTAKKLNRNNKNQLLIAEKQYQLAIQGINDQQLAQEQAKISEQARINQDLINQQIAHEEATYQSSIQYQQKQQELRDKIAILDIEAGKDEYKKQLDLLAKNQEIELRSVENNELAKAEIQKRYANQRVKVESYAASQMGEMAMATTQAFASSVAGAIMGAQSMEEAIKSTLEGLAQEAIARSIFATAMGFSALALGPIGGVSASQYFQSAALFAGVGAIAGVSSKAMGGGGGGGSSASVSPTGLAQAQAPSRPEASKAEPMVFNINFGGSVIYDTKAAAERAFADRIVRQINNSNRGMVRLNA
jgi:hypothetical protein